MIDLLIPATQRPEVLNITLASFKKHLFKNIDMRVFINVDPVGEDINPLYMENICHRFFTNVFCRVPEQPSFPEAFKWLWQRTTSDYIFHLEDDWELLRYVDLNALIGILQRHEKLVFLRLPQFHAYPTYMKNWNRIFTWNGEYYVPPEKWLGFCGHPALIKGHFVRACAPLIDVNLNPEKQFNHGINPKLTEEFDKWEYGVYGEPSKEGTPPLIQDNGKQWMLEHGYRKAENKAFFKRWEKIDE